VGKTWSPEDFTSLVDDVEERLFGTLPDDTWAVFVASHATRGARRRREVGEASAGAGQHP